MPVSVITDIVTWAELLIQAGITTVELGVLSYLVFDNGWLDMLRKISFFLDGLIIKYVDKFYSYFDKLLSGRIFHPDVVDKVMGNVYLFVAVFVLFKLMLLLIKYVVNPEMVSDEKVGTAALVKRVIIGMCIMLFLPNIFDLGIRLQSAVLSDNLFGQLLLDKSEIRVYEQNKNQMGRLLAFNVYQGFWNLDTSQVTDTRLITAYENAIEAKDPKVFGDINEKYGGDYAIDYFPILSSVLLLYVLYLIIKYCIDIVLRMFKLFLMQMLGPLAISDYMINGDSKEVFKSWVKTTVSIYLMLFMRVFSIWFVAFISNLMNKTCADDIAIANGVCKDSLLYIVNGQPDYLLRAIITIGLLAFLMDLPKLLSSVLGLDLEQDATVKGLMQKVGGAAKMLGVGAVAAGGAALGGAVGAAKGAFKGVAGQAQLRSALNKGKITPEQFKKASKENRQNMNKDMSSARFGAMKGIGSATVNAVGGAAGIQGLGQSFSQGYGSSEQEVQKNKNKRQDPNNVKNKISQMSKEKEEKEAEAKQDALQKQQHQETQEKLQNIQQNTASSAHQTATMNQKMDVIVDLENNIEKAVSLNKKDNVKSTAGVTISQGTMPATPAIDSEAIATTTDFGDNTLIDFIPDFSVPNEKVNAPLVEGVQTEFDPGHMDG